MFQGYGIGSVLNETYRLERELGRGGLGTVYAVVNVPEGRECAIRVLPRPADEFLVERERFLRDHKIVGQIGDPRLPAILGTATTPEGALLVLSELWRGETLRQRLRRGPLPPKAAFALVDSLCQVLGAAHQRGVPHGDVRPENIIFARGDRTLISDLGLHHFRVGPLRVFPKRPPGVGWYLPPEQIESRTREADPRGDVFALGALLYECATGRPAFPEPPAAQGMSPPTRGRSGMMAILRGAPESGEAGELVLALEQVLARACALRFDDRLPDAAALSVVLRTSGAAYFEDSGQVVIEGASGDSPTAGRRSKRRPLGAATGQVALEGEAAQAPAEAAPAQAAPAQPETAATAEAQDAGPGPAGSTDSPTTQAADTAAPAAGVEPSAGAEPSASAAGTEPSAGDEPSAQAEPSSAAQADSTPAPAPQAGIDQAGAAASGHAPLAKAGPAKEPPLPPIATPEPPLRAGSGAHATIGAKAGSGAHATVGARPGSGAHATISARPASGSHAAISARTPAPSSATPSANKSEGLSPVAARLAALARGELPKAAPRPAPARPAAAVPARKIEPLRRPGSGTDKDREQSASDGSAASTQAPSAVSAQAPSAVSAPASAASLLTSPSAVSSPPSADAAQASSASCSPPSADAAQAPSAVSSPPSADAAQAPSAVSSPPSPDAAQASSAVSSPPSPDAAQTPSAVSSLASPDAAQTPSAVPSPASTGAAQAPVAGPAQATASGATPAAAEPTAPAAEPPAAAPLPTLDGDPPASRPRDNSSAEAAKAIAAARAAASQRLLEAARKRARNEAVPQPIAASPSQTHSSKRRAPANLIEQPPAAGEVVTAPKEAPTLEAAQIIIDLPDVTPIEAPRHHAPPPLPAGVTASRPPAPASPLGNGRGGAVVSTQPMREIDGRPARRGDEVKQTEEVELVPLPAAQRSRTPVTAIVIALLLAGGAGLLLPRLLAPTPPPPPQVTTTAPPPAEDPARLLGEIDRALDVQDWRTAVLRADQLLRAAPSDATAQGRRRRAEAELQNQFRFDSFRAAVDRRNTEAALALYAEIPDDSFYKEKARESALALRGEYVQGKLTEARSARRLGLCTEVRRLTQSVLALEPANEEAQALDAKCDDKERPRAEAPPREAAQPASAPPAPRDPSRETPRRAKARPERKGPQEPPIPSLKDLRDPFRER